MTERTLGEGTLHCPNCGRTLALGKKVNLRELYQCSECNSYLEMTPLPQMVEIHEVKRRFRANLRRYGVSDDRIDRGIAGAVKKHGDRGIIEGLPALLRNFYVQGGRKRGWIAKDGLQLAFESRYDIPLFGPLSDRNVRDMMVWLKLKPSEGIRCERCGLRVPLQPATSSCPDCKEPVRCERCGGVREALNQKFCTACGEPFRNERMEAAKGKLDFLGDRLAHAEKRIKILCERTEALKTALPPTDWVEGMREEFVTINKAVDLAKDALAHLNQARRHYLDNGFTQSECSELEDTMNQLDDTAIKNLEILVGDFEHMVATLKENRAALRVSRK